MHQARLLDHSGWNQRQSGWSSLRETWY